MALSVSAAGDADSIREQLIADISLIFERTGKDRLPSSTLVEELVAMDDRPWPDYKRGKPIAPQQVARLLKPFGVTSGTIRFDDETTFKGYKRSDFDDVFRRYPPFQVVTTSQATEPVAYSDFPAVTNGHDVTATNRLKPASNKVCDVVTGKMGGCRPIASNEPEPGSVCLQCNKPIMADEEAVPVVGDGALHGRCYDPWLSKLDPRGVS